MRKEKFIEKFKDYLGKGEFIIPEELNLSEKDIFEKIYSEGKNINNFNLKNIYSLSERLWNDSPKIAIVDFSNKYFELWDDHGSALKRKNKFFECLNELTIEDFEKDSYKKNKKLESFVNSYQVEKILRNILLDKPKFSFFVKSL